MLIDDEVLRKTDTLVSQNLSISSILEVYFCICMPFELLLFFFKCDKYHKCQHIKFRM